MSNSSNFIIILFFLSAYFIFVELYANNPINFIPKVDQYFTKIYPKKPFIVVTFHTSFQTSLQRLSTSMWQNNSIIRSGIVETYIVLSTKSRLNQFHQQKYPSISISECTDDRNEKEGLTCRHDQLYLHYLKDFPQTNWFFRAMDDTWVDFENLYIFVSRLAQIYNPTQHLLLKGHANNEHELGTYFVHGGSGWIMSRAFIQYHFDYNWTATRLVDFSRYNQDDTAESLVLRRMFDEPDEWDTNAYQGFICGNCENLSIIKINSFPSCPSNVQIAAVKEIVGLHLFGYNTGQILLANYIKKAPKELFIWRQDRTQKSFLCYDERKDVWRKRQKYTIQSLKRHAVLKTAADLPVPLFLPIELEVGLDNPVFPSNQSLIPYYIDLHNKLPNITLPREKEREQRIIERHKLIDHDISYREDYSDD